ncbi:MAG TPA: penicillin-binding transpeptidase domain-containing protein [Flavihumibacter sp.]
MRLTKFFGSFNITGRPGYFSGSVFNATVVATVIMVAIRFAACQSPATDLNPYGDEPLEIREDFRDLFDSCGVQGTIVVYDYSNKKWIVSDTAEALKEGLPASTFKIPNLLFALEAGVIQSEHDTLRWPGVTDTVKYGYRPETYRDMTAAEAFDISAVWAYEEIAQRIGREKMREFLEKSRYGNGNLSQTETDFWNFGAFGITPVNMVQFLRDLYEEKLPFAKQHMDVVKNVMITEEGEGYRIHAKTGWTREGGINLGWWVGYLEGSNGVCLFATKLVQDRQFKRDDFGSCRKEITGSVLRRLGMMK